MRSSAATMYRCVLALLICIAVPFDAGADDDWRVSKNPALTAAIDAIATPYQTGKTPGMILAVLKRGEVIFLKSYGDANLEFHIPWDPTVVYTFYSTTKSMQAAAVFELQRQGRLRLSDSMYRYLPDFPRLNHDVTVGQLLNHTAGLWEDEAAVYYAATTTGDAALTLDELYELNRRQRSLPYRPGSNVFYSDTGNRLVARIIERVTGKSFGEAMQELLFRPAGMRTAVIKNRESTHYPRQATTYLMSRKVPAPAFEVANGSVETSGDGGGNGSILDYIAYARFLSQDIGGGVRRIDELAQEVSLRPNFSSYYRYGVIKQRHRGVDVVRHGGLWGKHVIYLPALDVWIVSMRNFIDAQSNDWVVEPLVDAVLASDSDASGLRAGRNPDWEETLSAPRPGKLSATELRLFNAVYVEPNSGMVLTFQTEARPGAIRYRMFREDAQRYLVRDPGQRGANYRTYGNGANPVNVRVSGDSLQVQYADWPEPRPLTVVKPDAPLPSLSIDGKYFSETLGAIYTIRSDARDTQLILGSGNRTADRYTLHRASEFVYEAAPVSSASYLSLPLSVRFATQGGVVTGFELLTPNVHTVEFSRLDSSTVGSQP